MPALYTVGELMDELAKHPRDMPVRIKSIETTYRDESTDSICGSEVRDVPRPALHFPGTGETHEMPPRKELHLWI